MSIVVLGMDHVSCRVNCGPWDGSCKLSCRLWFLGGCHTFWAMDYVSCPVDCGFWEVATRFGRWIMEVVLSIVVLGRLPHVLGDGSCKLSCRLWFLGGCHTFLAMDHVSCPVDCGFWEVATRFGRWVM